MSIVDVFPLEDDQKKLASFLLNLKKRGMDEHYLSQEHGFGLSILTSGTLLTIETEINAYGDIKRYYLKCEDKLLCTTIIKNAAYEGYIHSYPESFYGAPPALIPNMKVEENISHKIIFPLGWAKPLDIDISHLSLLGIKEENFHVTSSGYWNLEIDDERFSLKGDDLTYKGKTIATYSSSFLDIDDTAIAAFTSEQLVNEQYLKYPLSLNKREISGHVEACVKEIANNYKAKEYYFVERYKDPHYEPFDHQKCLMLINALQRNTYIKEVSLGHFAIQKSDLKNLLIMLQNHPSIHRLSIYNAKIDIQPQEVDEIYTIIKNCVDKGKDLYFKENTYSIPDLPLNNFYTAAYPWAKPQLVPVVKDSEKKPTDNSQAPVLNSTQTTIQDKQTTVINAPSPHPHKHRHRLFHIDDWFKNTCIHPHNHHSKLMK